MRPMRLHDEYEMTCLCGKDHIRPVTVRNFTCECGRKSLIDWSNVETGEIYRRLNGAQMLSDALAKEIENRRQKVDEAAA